MLRLLQQTIIHQLHSATFTRYLMGAVLVIGIAAGLLAGAGQVWAQGTGDINLLGNHHEIDFPRQITIEVTVEGEHEIVEVKTNYRPAGSQVWAYGYSNFNSSQQVTARFSIPTSGPDYVPPGAQVEYYHAIRDSQGNVYETPVTTLDYLDTRFQWDQTRIGSLTLFHHDLRPSRVDDVARDLDREIQRVESLLQLETQQPIRGFIYNGFAEAAPAFPGQSRTITEEQVFHGFAFPSYGVFLGIGAQPSLIVHETAHLMLAQTLDARGRSIPSWLDEGFATYMEPGSNPYSGRSLSGQGPPLRAMSTVSGTPDEINYFYLKAESVVSYLINEYGTQSFQTFLSEIQQGRPLDTALVNTYGFDTAGLEAEWAASPVGQSSPSPARQRPASPFVLFNSWLLGGLVLVVATLVFIRYVVRKLRPSDEDQDWESPWDD